MWVILAEDQQEIHLAFFEWWLYYSCRRIRTHEVREAIAQKMLLAPKALIAESMVVKGKRLNTKQPRKNHSHFEREYSNANNIIIYLFSRYAYYK